ncbi:hypothetical protein [Paenibacillus popilliae]|nr:hypothetical protein [Paenibacillus popilliae]
MKKAELIAKLNELFGDEDVEIYVERVEKCFAISIDQGGNATIKPSGVKSTFKDDFEIYMDQDGDAIIEP